MAIKFEEELAKIDQREKTRGKIETVKHTLYAMISATLLIGFSLFLFTPIYVVNSHQTMLATASVGSDDTLMIMPTVTVSNSNGRRTEVRPYVIVAKKDGFTVSDISSGLNDEVMSTMSIESMSDEDIANHVGQIINSRLMRRRVFANGIYLVVGSGVARER